MSAKWWRPWPKAGDIVDCHFPETVGVPGPKERPALVLEVEESLDNTLGCVVTVAYATSKKITQVYPGEFVVSARDRSTGLHVDTKFDLARNHRLPFDSAWFAPVSGSKPPHPRIGRLDLTDNSVRRKLQTAIKAAFAKKHK